MKIEDSDITDLSGNRIITDIPKVVLREAIYLIAWQFRMIPAIGWGIIIFLLIMR